MTAPEPEYEWGVEWTYPDGRRYVAPCPEAGARRMVERCTAAHGYKPHAAALVRRPVAEWLPVPQEPGKYTK